MKSHDRPPAILIAEENSVNQKVALRMLEKLGFTADVVANGLEALGALHRRPYDIILMDVQMPEMDGVTATQHIRNDWSSDQQPWIIALTVDALPGDLERYLEAGMDGYISKPISLEALADTLHNIIHQRRPPREADSGSEQQPGPIDIAEFAERLGPGQDDLLRELVTLFIDESTPLMLALRTAAEGQDAGTTRQLAHKLKGSSAQIAAVSFAAAAQKLEDAARAGNVDGAATILAMLETEFNRIRLWSSDAAAASPPA